MVRDFGKKVVVWTVVLILAFLTTATASALSSERLGKFSNYQIYFYDPDANNCIELDRNLDGNDDFEPGGGSWDGHCSNVGSYGSQIEKYFDTIYSVAQKNGLPWEGIVAQLIGESGFMKNEVCPYNPLGLKGSPSCDGKHRSFGSYDEAFNYYVNSIKPVRMAMGLFKNDPYKYVDFLINGVPGYKYATDPNYVNKISGHVCGVQQWAKAHGKPISGSGHGVISGEGSEEIGEAGGALYCNENNDEDDEDDDYEPPESGNLVDYIRKWAWPEYHAEPYTTRMPAYADYMDNVATYKGGCEGADCGAFVANIMKASGWDPNYVQAGTAAQQNYLSSHWKKVSVGSLKLGDVGIKPGHVILYVGSIPGFGSDTASASQCKRAPMAGRDKNLGQYTWYRRT